MVEMEISKTSLETVFKNQIQLNKIKDSITVEVRSKNQKIKIQDLKYSKKQSWTSYMGYRADSKYD
jgi:hypothetical protein